jgi:hypothetical protein
MKHTQVGGSGSRGNYSMLLKLLLNVKQPLPGKKVELLHLKLLLNLKQPLAGKR